MEPHQLIARYIRGQLAMSGFTQQQVANATGIVQQALSRRLTGQTPFSIDDLTAVVQLLGINYAEMVDEVQKMATREARRGNGNQKKIGVVLGDDDEGTEVEVSKQPSKTRRRH
jgi:transcriptional regulator with XRE-family HTH domain